MGIAEVKKVIDPYTIELRDSRVIRLTGIDIPDFDMHEPGPLSRTAHKILKDMLQNQKIHIFQTKDKSRGRFTPFRHHIAHLERRADDAWIQGTLLSLGLARVRTSPYNYELFSEMLEEENKARAQKIGLWEHSDYKILTPIQANNAIGQFHVVEGFVYSLRNKGNTLIIYLSKNKTSPFKVLLSSEIKNALQKAQIDPLNWNGKKIRVRGQILKNAGLEIIITHPEQIELQG